MDNYGYYMDSDKIDEIIDLIAEIKRIELLPPSPIEVEEYLGEMIVCIENRIIEIMGDIDCYEC